MEGLKTIFQELHQPSNPLKYMDGGFLMGIVSPISSHWVIFQPHQNDQIGEIMGIGAETAPHDCIEYMDGLFSHDRFIFIGIYIYIHIFIHGKIGLTYMDGFTNHQTTSTHVGPRNTLW